MLVKCNIPQYRRFFNLRYRSSGNYLLSQAVTRQVSSTLRSLTSVFGMGTGGSSLLSSPDFFEVIPSKLNNTTSDFQQINSSELSALTLFLPFLNLRSSPRTISIGQLNTLLHLHLRPINHVVFMGPYQPTLWEILS